VALDVGGIDAPFLEGVAVPDVAVQRDGGLDPLDDELRQGAPA
jgi:hypothetical protein